MASIPDSLNGPEQMISSAGEKNTLLTSFNEKDSFFLPGQAIDPYRWSKLYPYELLWLKKDGEGWEIFARYTFPFTFTDLTEQTPFAINGSVTSGGYAEEHNGVPIKLIQFQGTTGVNPLRGAPETPVSVGLARSIFGGSIEAASRTIASAKGVFGTPTPTPKPHLLPSTYENGFEGKTTGYYQFQKLRVFLQAYAAAKKAGDKFKDDRLAFAMWKDEQVYLVTPMVFIMQRTAASPLRYNYNIQLKAFKKINLWDTASAAPPPPITVMTRSQLQNMLARFRAARRTIANTHRTVSAVRTDVDRILDITRSCILCLNGKAGSHQTIADLPKNLVRDLKTNVLNLWDESTDAWDESYQNTFGDRSKAISDLAAVKSSSVSANQEAMPSVLDEMFEDPDRYVDFLDTVPLDNLRLNPAQQALVDTELERVQSFSPTDYETMRNTVQEFADSFTNTVGANDAVYAETYGLNISNTDKEPTQDDYNALFALNDLVSDLTTLANQPQTNSSPTLDYVAGLAAQAGTAFVTPVSKYAAPFPYGFTMERLAQMYLGDPDRWIEIATLNGLREPYVDEVGFDVPLVANGTTCQITVGSDTNLHLGQPVWIQSSLVRREKRHIVGIEKVAPGFVVLTLDGKADLDKYTLAANAFMHAYLPDTVNSQMLIYLPSMDEGMDLDEFKKIPGVDAFDPLLDVSGVDLLLDGDSDLAVTEDGDCGYAYGLQNIVQSIRLALGTMQGSLLRHPEYGFPLKGGESIADVSASDILAAIKGMFANDQSITSIDSVDVLVNGPVAHVTVTVSVKGQSMPIAVVVEVKR